MKFAFLNLQEHPRGNLILKQLIENDLIPSLVIEEQSSLAEKNRASILSTFEDAKTTFPSTKNLTEKFSIPLFKVDNHNNDECQKLLADAKIDLIVLGDTRIIKGNIRDIPKIGTINSHPGYLPDVRGNNPYIWAIIHDLPQGCSIHFIDENVDTGDIILRQKIDPDSYSSYQELLEKINNLCASLMTSSVQQIKNNNYSRVPQSQLKFENRNHNGEEFFLASAVIKQYAIEKLKRQR